MARLSWTGSRFNEEEAGWSKEISDAACCHTNCPHPWGTAAQPHCSVHGIQPCVTWGNKSPGNNSPCIRMRCSLDACTEQHGCWAVLYQQPFTAISFSLYPAGPDETGSSPSASAHREVIPPEHAWHMLPDQTEVPLHICCLVYSSPCFSFQNWDIPRMHLPPRAPCQPGGSVASRSACEVLCCQGCPCYACGAHPWLSFPLVQCWGPRVGSR